MGQSADYYAQKRKQDAKKRRAQASQVAAQDANGAKVGRTRKGLGAEPPVAGSAPVGLERPATERRDPSPSEECVAAAYAVLGAAGLLSFTVRPALLSPAVTWSLRAECEDGVVRYLAGNTRDPRLVLHDVGYAHLSGKWRIDRWG